MENRNHHHRRSAGVACLGLGPGGGRSMGRRITMYIVALLAVCAAVLAASVVSEEQIQWAASGAPERLTAVSDIQKEPQEREDTENKLLDVEMDADLQRDIYTLCGADTELFCAVLAIATAESGLDPDMVGDGGDSVGLMQINIPAQQERMQALGVTDLFDPGQNVAVAVDYLQWIMARMGTGCADQSTYMAYNMGLTGAQKALESGTVETAYSRAVFTYYAEYLQEVGQ